MSEIIIYQNPENQVQVEVQFEGESFWLSLNQIAVLFERDKSVISRHLKNIFQSEELDRSSVVAKNATTASDGKTYDVEYFNLDAILSVGYRVNSKQGTRFRQWATRRLKDFLLKGYALNEKRLNEAEERYLDLKRAISLAARAGDTERLSSGEAKGILNVLSQYSFALETLDKYDHQRLTLDIESTTSSRVNKLTYKDAIKQINIWRDNQKTGKLFGIERGHSFKSSLDSIYQSIRGKDLYPSIEEKAVNLLYFIVKNHSFTDGNKRIAAGLFVYFLDLNKKLYDESGKKIIGDNVLVAITIMIAESSPAERDMMIKLVVNLIINGN
jgi:prophage maintenance system killer protein